MADGPMRRELLPVEGFTLEFLTTGRLPKCPPNPAFPDGIDADMSLGAAVTCTFDLPYPARCCGVYVVTCPRCGLRYGLTVAGRPDDPRSVKIGCPFDFGKEATQ